MKKLSAGQIKILKVFHLVFVMMWVVGVAAMALLCLIKANSGDELFMVFHITRFIDDVFVIPGAILTVVTGIVYGAFSNWGFFKLGLFQAPLDYGQVDIVYTYYCYRYILF